MSDRPWAVIISAALVSIGSLLPWVSIPLLSLAGVEGDGIFTLVAGVVAAGVAFAKGRGDATGWTAIVAGAATLWIAGGVVSNLSATPDNVGTGLILTLIAGAALLLTGIAARKPTNIDASAAAPNVGGRLSELERLGDLLDRGVLTEPEFEREKQRLIERSADHSGAEISRVGATDRSAFRRAPAGTTCSECGYMQTNPRTHCKRCRADLGQQLRRQDELTATLMLFGWEMRQIGESDDKMAAADMRDRVLASEPGLIDRFIRTVGNMSFEGRNFAEAGTLDLAVRRSGYQDARRRILLSGS